MIAVKTIVFISFPMSALTLRNFNKSIFLSQTEHTAFLGEHN